MPWSGVRGTTVAELVKLGGMRPLDENDFDFPESVSADIQSKDCKHISHEHYLDDNQKNEAPNKNSSKWAKFDLASP